MQMTFNGDLVLNEREVYTVAESEKYFVDVVPMIYNHRVVLTPKEDTTYYVAGWCYPNLLSAVAAVLAWSGEPDAEEPVGYLKRAI